MVTAVPGMVVGTLPVADNKPPHDDPFNEISMGVTSTKQDHPFGVGVMDSHHSGRLHQQLSERQMNEDNNRDKDNSKGGLVNPFDLFT